MTGSNVGAGLPTRRFYYVLVLLGMTQDGRLSLQGQQDRSKKICTKAEASQRRSLKVTTYPSPQRSKVGESSGYKGIALRQVVERIALRSGPGVCGKRPTRLLTGIKTRVKIKLSQA